MTCFAIYSHIAPWPPALLLFIFLATSQQIEPIEAAASWTYFSSWNVSIATKTLPPDSGNGSDVDAAELAFYESSGFNVETLQRDYTTFAAGHHVQDFNSVEGYWKVPGGQVYPYVGKSKDKSADMGGVSDLIVHPPPTADYTVVRFRVPKDGNYQADLLGSRRVGCTTYNGPNDVTNFAVYNSSLSEIYRSNNVDTTTILPTPSSANSDSVIALGALQEGQYIYFATDGAGSMACDNVFVRFRIGLEGAPLPCNQEAAQRYNTLALGQRPSDIGCTWEELCSVTERTSECPSAGDTFDWCQDTPFFQFFDAPKSDSLCSTRGVVIVGDMCYTCQ